MATTGKGLPRSTDDAVAKIAALEDALAALEARVQALEDAAGA